MADEKVEVPLQQVGEPPGDEESSVQVSRPVDNTASDTE